MADPSLSSMDVEKIGRVMATLDDFRLLQYVLIVVIIGLGLLVAWLFGGIGRERRETNATMAAERERMWSVADKFGAAADKIGEQTDKLVVELRVLRALSSRVEVTKDAG